jgi:preprotein translocase subunit SecA
VEAHNFDIRKQLLEYDNVANDQRKTIYELRNQILEGTDETIDERVKNLRDGVLEDIFRQHVPADSVEEQWDLDGLSKALAAELFIEAPVKAWADEGMDDEAMLERLREAGDAAFKSRTDLAPAETLNQYKRFMLLQVLDHEWREHLAMLDHLRQGIHLRGYAQKNPRQEYKREGFDLFGQLIERIKLDVTRALMRVQVKTQEEVERAEAQAPAVANVTYQHAGYDEALATVATEKPKPVPFVKSIAKVGRNDPCPCGSGKKYKHCHGRLS